MQNQHKIDIYDKNLLINMDKIKCICKKNCTKRSKPKIHTSSLVTGGRSFYTVIMSLWFNHYLH